MSGERQRRAEQVARGREVVSRREEAPVATPASASETPEEQVSPQPRRARFTHFESWIDRQIRQAQERGDFDNLRGKGAPLTPDDPNVRAFAGDDALGLKLLKDNEALPAWIELNKEIAAAREACQRLLGFYEQEPNREQRRRFAERYRRRASELNDKIDHYNLIVPARSLEQLRVRAELELRDADQRRWARLAANEG